MDATITFSGLYCPECHCSTSFLPTPAGESAVTCNNRECGKTVMLSCAAEAFITQEQLVTQRALAEVNAPDVEGPSELGGGGEGGNPPPDTAHWMHRFSDRPRAFTRISIEVERRIVTCPNCRGIHHISDCPEIRAALFAPSWTGVDLGRVLCRMRWKDHRGFVALLSTLETARLTRYADCYIAFIHENRPDTDLSVGQLLHTWLQLIADASDDGTPPAAPAARLRLAA